VRLKRGTPRGDGGDSGRFQTDPREVEAL